MRPLCLLSVPGGNLHTIPMHRLHALQSIVSDVGAERSPLFLRMAATPLARIQPVTARALLAEIEAFGPRLTEIDSAGIVFLDARANELGRIYARANDEPITADPVQVSVTDQGIRLVVADFPPPVGFRSAPGMAPGHYECYFTELLHGSTGWTGVRTEAMGGSGSPVPLPALALPPVTRWDYSRVAGAPEVRGARFFRIPASDAFHEVVHAVEAACTESLRLKQPLQIKRD